MAPKTAKNRPKWHVGRGMHEKARKKRGAHLRETSWLDRSKEAFSGQQSAGAKRAEKSAKTAVPLVHDQKQLGSVLKIMGQRLA